VSILFQPGRIRHSIEKNRFVWERLLPQNSTEALEDMNQES